jgi:hypothetical protein
MFLKNRMLVLVIFLLVLGGLPGCAVRSVPPIKYVPVLGYKPDYSMEGILHRALGDQNPAVRKDAVRLLGKMINTPDEQRRSAEAVGRALNDKEEPIRLEAVRALGNIASSISGPYLSKALTDKSVRVRVQVIQELREAYQRQSGQLQTLGANQ